LGISIGATSEGCFLCRSLGFGIHRFFWGSCFTIPRSHWHCLCSVVPDWRPPFFCFARRASFASRLCCRPPPAPCNTSVVHSNITAVPSFFLHMFRRDTTSCLYLPPQYTWHPFFFVDVPNITHCLPYLSVALFAFSSDTPMLPSYQCFVWPFSFPIPISAQYRIRVYVISVSICWDLHFERACFPLCLSSARECQERPTGMSDDRRCFACKLIIPFRMNV
jgi:hypothetical protein